MPIKKSKKKVIKVAKKKVIKKVVKKTSKVGKTVSSKVQDTRHWVKRPYDDEHNDWGTKDPNWISEYWSSQAHPHRAVLLEAIKALGEFENILEVGSNCGPNLQQVKNLYPNVDAYGLDANADAVKAGMAWCPATFILGEAQSIPFNDKQFDVVLADAVLMYIKPDEIKGVIKEMARVAKKSIVLVEWFDKSLEGKLVDFHYARNYPKLLEEEGFAVSVEHKLTEEEWPNPRWIKHGYVYIFHRL